MYIDFTLQYHILDSIRSNDKTRLLACLSMCSNDHLLLSVNQGYVWSTAVGESQLEIIKILVDYGFDINKLDSYKRNPLMYSMVIKNMDIMNYLIDQGAKMSVGSPHNYLYRRECYLDNLKNLFTKFVSVDNKFCSYSGDFAFVNHIVNKKRPRIIVQNSIEKFMDQCRFSLMCKAKIVSKFVVFELD